jgi:hypothetical protein
VFVLREALDAFIRECGMCGSGRPAQWLDAPADSFCANCSRAVAALQMARRVT